MTFLAEKVTMSNFDVTDGTNTPRMIPMHHKLQGTLGVALPVNARGNGNSVVVILALMVSPSNMTLDFATTGVLCYHGGKQLPSCMKFLQALGDACHVNFASISLLCYKVASACGENGRRQTGRSADV